MTPTVCDTIPECPADTALIHSIYEGLPEDGARLLLLSREGRWRSEDPGDADSAAIPNLDAWPDIVRRLDDGDEPVVMGTHDATLVVTELPHRIAPGPGVLGLCLCVFAPAFRGSCPAEFRSDPDVSLSDSPGLPGTVDLRRMQIPSRQGLSCPGKAYRYNRPS
jgi:hypothetical protein